MPKNQKIMIFLYFRKNGAFGAVLYKSSIYDYFFILVTSIYDFGWAFGPAKIIYIVILRSFIYEFLKNNTGENTNSIGIPFYPFDAQSGASG